MRRPRNYQEQEEENSTLVLCWVLIIGVIVFFAPWLPFFLVRLFVVAVNGGG